MSFLIGTLSGAVVAGGVYYGFSNMIQNLSEQHQRDLATLSARLIAPPSSTVPAPPPASERIARHPVKSLLKGKWNEEINNVFRGVYGWERGISEWGRRWLYGGTR